jgi:N-acetylmuramoyl-L-alanine amidase
MVRVVIEYQEAMKIYPVVAEGGNVYIDLALPSQELPPQTPNLSPIPAQEMPTPLQSPENTFTPQNPLQDSIPSEPTPSDSKEEPKVLEKPPKVIVIDPGHGGKDAGAIGNGVVEKEIVLQIALQLSQQLRDMGYTVYMTRTNDTFIELKERTQLANDKLADLFLSIHANSIPKTSDPLATRGVETYYLSPGRSERAKGVAAFENAAAMSEMGEYGKLSFLNIINSEKILASHKLAIDIERGVTGVLQKHYANVKNNGAKEAPFWVLVGAQMPAILLEIGYISHPEESAHLANREYQQGIVQGMVEGVTHYFINNP